MPLLAGFTSPVKSVAIGTVRQVYSPDIGTGDTTQISKLLGGMQIDKRRSMMHMTQVFGGRRFIGGSYPTSSSTNSPARPASVYSFDPNSLNAMLKASEETATAKEDKEEEKKNSGETYEQKCTSDDETTGVECNSILAIEEVEGEEEKHTQVCIVEALVQPALLLLHAEQVVSPQHSLMAIYTEAVVAAKEEEGDLPKECFTRTIDLNAIDAALDACSTGKQSSPAVEDVIVEDVQSEEDDEDDDDQNTLSNEEDHQQLPQYEAESMASNKADHEISEPVETAVTIKEE